MRIRGGNKCRAEDSAILVAPDGSTTIVRMVVRDLLSAETLFTKQQLYLSISRIGGGPQGPRIPARSPDSLMLITRALSCRDAPGAMGSCSAAVAPRYRVRPGPSRVLGESWCWGCPARPTPTPSFQQMRLRDSHRPYQFFRQRASRPRTASICGRTHSGCGSCLTADLFPPTFTKKYREGIEKELTR